MSSPTILPDFKAANACLCENSPFFGHPQDDNGRGENHMSDTTTEDFVAANHGSFVLLWPVTEAARSWVDDHIPDDAPVLAGRIAIELRYAPAVFEGIESGGLTIA